MSAAVTDERRPKRKPVAFKGRRHVVVPFRLASRRELDDWRRRQHDWPRRKEALRRLLVMALKNEGGR